MFDFSIGEIFIILLAILIFVPTKDIPIFTYKVGKNYQKVKYFSLKLKINGVIFIKNWRIILKKKKK